MDATLRTDPVIERIGGFIADARLEIDDATMASAQSALIDLLGCIVVGSREEVATKAREALLVMSGDAPAFGTHDTFAPTTAAFVNAVAGHAIDFDDWEIPGNTHPSISIIPALLAATTDRPVSGREFAEAYIVGFEVIARLGEGLNFTHYDAGWHSTATFGPMGAAAAVARMWGLDATTAAHAVAIAVSRASGLTAQFGSDAKPLQGGFAAEAGLTAAMLARAGLTGKLTALQGPSGYNKLTAHGDDARLRAAFDRMGQPLSLSTYGLVFKPYPSCGYTHRIVDAALKLRDVDIAIGRIASIEIELPDFHADVLPFMDPANAREARFSLPFCAALALTRGGVTAKDFIDEAWRDPTIAHLVGLTRVAPFKPLDPGLNYDPRQPDRMHVHLDDGTTHEASVDYPLGAPQNPMSLDDIVAKFTSLTMANSDDIAALIAWPDCPNIHDLLKPWSAPK
ncbi:MAG: MmgE/PrpD family protein [Alphaproteobacteria bacterium]